MNGESSSLSNLGFHLPPYANRDTYEYVHRTIIIDHKTFATQTVNMRFKCGWYIERVSIGNT
jgi:hypothetical protein